MSKLNSLSIVDAKTGLKKKDFSVKELVQAHLDSMQKHKDLNMYVLETAELALANAEISQKKIAADEAGLLEGIPVGVKDLYCTKDFRTTACSNILKDFVPKYESTVSAKLFAQGGIMLGKTNMDEFAMGSSNENSYFGPVKNPWNLEHVPGGSSGGSGGRGGTGGSGVVVIRYVSSSQRGTGGTVTSSGGYYYHTFTSSGTYTA